MNTSHRLTRSDDRIVAGVLGGFAEFLDIDPTLLRVAYVLLAILVAGFPAIAIYIVCWLIIPSKHSKSILEEKMDEKRAKKHARDSEHKHAEPVSHETKTDESKKEEVHSDEPRID